MTTVVAAPELPLTGGGCGTPWQLPLPLAFAEGPSPLIVTAANRPAVTVLDRPGDWASRTLILTGPRRSGRSLHARLAAAAGARVLDGADRREEAELFAVWQDAQGGAPLLLVADRPPPFWAVELPDLRTRLAAASVAVLDHPDDAMADQLAELLLARAGVASTPTLRAEALRPLERTHLAIERLVDALAASGPLTRVGIAHAHRALGIRAVAA